MKLAMKKTIAVLLALLLLCGAWCVAAEEAEPDLQEAVSENLTDAEDPTNAGDPTNPVDPTNPEDPTEPGEPTDPEEPTEDAAVAKLYLCGRVSFFGHIWIYVKNLTDAPIMVGCYEVPAGSGVSVGTHKYSRADGGGVYYNVEAYMIHKRGSSRGVARSMELNADQLAKVSNNILTHNTWSLSNNCGYFATRVWNCVSSRKVSASFLPLTVKNRIGSTTGPKMITPARSEVYRQRGSGSNARLVTVSSGSLKYGIG